MITLTLLEAQNKTPLENWRFDESPVIRVGRAADNDIVLDSNLVSRYHLELKNTNSKNKADSWEIISKGTNGTFLNGVLVTHAPLPNKCFLQLARGGLFFNASCTRLNQHLHKFLWLNRKIAPMKGIHPIICFAFIAVNLSQYS